MAPSVKADPGIGRESAPTGSRAWAERVRLTMQGLVSSVDTNPSAIKFYVDLVKEHHAWTLMNRDDGTFFRSFEEFCEYRQPWGLGRPWPTLKPFLVAVCGGNEAQVEALTASPAPEAKPPAPGPGRGHVKATDDGKALSSDYGNGSSYLAARIARDAPEVHERLKRGEFPSMRAAAMAAGLVKPADPVKAAARALKKVPEERRHEMLTGDVRGLQMAIRKLTHVEQVELHAWLGREIEEIH